MNTAAKLGDVLHELYPQCRHERTEVRYKTFGNGTRHLCTQCLICGAKTDGSKWLPSAGVDMSQVRPFDEVLEREYQRRTDRQRRSRIAVEKRERHLEYERYIRESEDWWAIRTKVMRRDNNWCQACFEATATEVHHLTYEHLYEEILWELKAVCSDCHRRIHGLIE